MKRLLTALGLIAVAAYLVFGAPAPLFIAGAFAFGLLCYWEYSGLVAGHSIPRPGIAGWLTGLLIVFFPGVHLAGSLYSAPRLIRDRAPPRHAARRSSARSCRFHGRILYVCAVAFRH